MNDGEFLIYTHKLMGHDSLFSHLTFQQIERSMEKKSTVNMEKQSTVNLEQQSTVKVPYN